MIPDSVTSISDYALYSCNYLKDVYYDGTSDAWEAISIGSNNTSLTNAIIHYNYKASRLVIPAATTTIESEAFAYLPNVDIIEMTGNVHSIADDAFAGSDIIIVAPAGSYAENWAHDHHIEFIQK